MAAKPGSWKLTLGSDLRLLPLIRSFLEGVCQAADCDASTTDAVVIATDEAVNNIIRHAHRGHPEATLEVRCFFQADHIEICVLDEGAPFDLAAVPHLDPAELRIGGRGVFLMRSLMDELSCQPRGKHGNLLRMVKRRPTSPLLRGA
jgi:serine/threonine-protein kinase RsbW